MIRNNWIETGMSITNSTSFDYASTTRSGIYVDDDRHIVMNNLCITDMGNGTGIIRNNYTNANTSTYACVRLPLTFECCTNPFHEELYRENIENVYNPQLSDAIARHEENLARNREESIRERQLILDRREKEKQERQLASERAKSLLLEFLDEENKQRLFGKQNLEILSALFPDITYIIPTTEKNEMVKAINKQKGDVEIDRLCLTVSEIDEDNQDNWLPIEDVILSKVLYLLNAEEDFLRIARHHSRSDNHENLYARLVPEIPVEIRGE